MVLDFHIGVAVHGRAAFAVKSGSVEVDLDLAHHIDVGLAGQLGRGFFVEGDVHVVVLFLVIDGDLAVDAGSLDEVADFLVVVVGPGLGETEAEVEVGALDDVEGQADDGGGDFLVGLLGAASFGGNVVDVRDSFRTDGDLVHREAGEVADAAAEAAVQDEGVLGALHSFGDLSVDDFLEFFLTEVDGAVVHRVHDGTFLLSGEAAEGRLHDFVRLLQLIEEGLEILHCVDHSIDGGTVIRVAAGSALLFHLIEFGVLLDILVFIEYELAVFEEEVCIEFFRGDFGKAVDEEEALEFVCLADDHLVALCTDDTVTAGFVGKADVALAEGLSGGVADFDDGVQNLLYLFLQDIGGHVHTLGLHQMVGLAHGLHVGIDVRLQLLVVDGDSGAEFSVKFKFVQVGFLGPDAGLVIKRNVSPIYETKPDAEGVALGGSPVVHQDSFHNSLVFFYVQI